MALYKSPATTDASQYSRQNEKNKGFPSYSLRTRVSFGATLFSLLYILLLNISTGDSGKNGLPQLRLNHRPPRSLSEAMMFGVPGNMMTQIPWTRRCTKKNKEPLPNESVGYYMEKSCRHVKLTDEMKDKLISCGPNITEADMSKIYIALYNQHISNFRHLIECLYTACAMLSDKYKRDQSYQNKCWRHQYQKLGRECIKLTDNDDDGHLKLFLNKCTTCKTSDFIDFLNDSINRWNAFIKQHKKTTYSELKEALESGILQEKKDKK
ncbi:hypothetical protein AK88_03799 [Plasmodium fragile]|uniref:Plasmodium RESA N-terminal domain-containing protein n=1 Tax=Plasmodium fragile TaxID=5857 RepID=A0A0D9QI38_PLAFR|nr:uncharacterized protein AK88_03799 [Plasmodium fragile]KJP86603.1 hypothetical protein AK88_03799 [Plasmodium fragile]